MAATFSEPPRAGRSWALPGAAILLAAGLLAACGGGSSESPGPDDAIISDLAGADIMVLPVQRLAGELTGDGDLARNLDAEIEFWTRERGRELRWLFASEIERAADRSPELQVQPRSLAVGGFRQARLRYINDPLLGDLRKMGALVDRRFALLPIEASVLPLPDRPDRRVIRIRLAIVDTVGGRILWLGAIAGDDAPAGDPVLVASAARAFAAAFLP